MSDGDDGEQEEEKVAAPVEPKKFIPPPKKGTKNKGGDYVVTTLDIPDFRDGIKDKKKEAQESDSDSDEGYGDEDEPAKETNQEATPAVEGKYTCFTKIVLSKKPYLNFLIVFFKKIEMVKINEKHPYDFLISNLCSYFYREKTRKETYKEGA